MNSIFGFLMFFYLYAFVTSDISIAAKNILAPYEVLSDGQTLVSANERFELGFFYSSSGNRDMRYLGIWYKNIPLTVVWVANRMKPLRCFGARLVLDMAGNLTLHDGTGNMILVSRLTKAVNRPFLQLLDSGNLVIRDQGDQSDGGYPWQSFDYPCDTLLPGMKLGWNFNSGLDRVMSSWRNNEDPSIGEFSFSLELKQAPQLVLEKNTLRLSRWGPWDGQRFSGSDAFKTNPVFIPKFNSDAGEVYFTYEVLDNSILLRFLVTPLGTLQFLKWKNNSKEWIPVVYLNKDSCDRYGSCGPNGICYVDDPSCQCLKGFTANSPIDWGRLDWTDGCRRNYALNCSDGDGFVKYEGLKLPDNSTIWGSLSLEECEEKCLKECSCMAYTNIDIYRNGSFCVVWLSNLTDVRNFPHGGDELYIRMARHELERIAFAKKQKEVTIIIVVFASTILGMLLICMTDQCISLRQAMRQDEQASTSYGESIGIMDEDMNFHHFQLRTLSAATDNFSSDNKIGQGGFGRVYKGELPNGEEIAVKRLSQHSYQGILEFKNEIYLIARLQHRNLVKLLGYCIQRGERMLVYEYMPNKSLDQFIFDEARKRLLPWEKRFDIVKGVAKGLVYLHHDSRLRIIHRDLKTSNILLDNEMNPKISDLGLARSFADEAEETTRRVIGTHGYMPPEYVMDGHYSIKSDVYSFGVLVLEIISGQKNWGFQHPDHDLNLLGHAWKLWNEGRALELMDPELEESFVESEVSRCIHVGLLCVQTRSEGRPTMPSVIYMLQNESAISTQPLEPGFFTRSFTGIGSSSGVQNPQSANGVTVSTLSGR